MIPMCSWMAGSNQVKPGHDIRLSQGSKPLQQLRLFRGEFLLREKALLFEPA